MAGLRYLDDIANMAMRRLVGATDGVVGTFVSGNQDAIRALLKDPDADIGAFIREKGAHLDDNARRALTGELSDARDTSLRLSSATEGFTGTTPAELQAHLSLPANRALLGERLATAIDQNPSFYGRLFNSFDSTPPPAAAARIPEDGAGPRVTRGEITPRRYTGRELSDARSEARSFVADAHRDGRINIFKRGELDSNQLAELRTRMLQAYPDMDPSQAVGVISRAVSTAKSGPVAFLKGVAAAAARKTATVAAVGATGVAVVEGVGQLGLGVSPIGMLTDAYNFVSSFSNLPLDANGMPDPTAVANHFNEAGGFLDGAKNMIAQYVGPEIATAIIGLASFALVQQGLSLVGVDKLPLGGLMTMVAGGIAAYKAMGSPDLSGFMPSSAPSPTGMA